MTTMTVLGIDPGGATGWALYRGTVMIPTLDHDTSLMPILGSSEFYDEEWCYGTIDERIRSIHMEDLIALLEMHETDDYTIVCERFIQRPGKIATADDFAQKLIGTVETFRVLHPNTKLVMQMPAQAKGFVKDANIRKLGLWFPGKANRHAMDALRHVLFFMVHQTAKREELLEKGWKF